MFGQGWEGINYMEMGIGAETTRLSFRTGNTLHFHILNRVVVFYINFS